MNYRRGRADRPFSLAFALAMAGAGLHFLRREIELARQPIKELNHIVEQHDLPPMAVWADLMQGWLRTHDGGAEGGLAQIRRAMTTWREMGALTGVSFQTLVLVEAYGRTGLTEDALREVERVLDLTEEIDERCFVAELRRLKGELLLAGARSVSAVTENGLRWLQSALDLSHEQGANAFELRAAISLAHVWQRKGRTREAERVLRRACQGFDEGGSSPDLMAAAALLDKLPGV